MEESKGVCWKKWEELCLLKVEGGLGFRELEAFNFALLAKQGWQLIKFLNSLVAKVLKGQYHAQHSFLEAKATIVFLLYGKVFWKLESC